MLSSKEIAVKSLSNILNDPSAPEMCRAIHASPEWANLVRVAEIIANDLEKEMKNDRSPSEAFVTRRVDLLKSRLNYIFSSPQDKIARRAALFEEGSGALPEIGKEFSAVSEILATGIVYRMIAEIEVGKEHPGPRIQ